MARYCKACKMNVQDEHLYKGEQCPLCGAVLEAPMVFTARPKVKRTEQEYVIRIEFTNGKKGDMIINEEQFNKLNSCKTSNVVSWYVVKQYDANSN